MRLVTWNCYRGPYEKKSAALDGLKPDVAVMQECSKPVTNVPGVLWFGQESSPGLAIQVRQPFSVDILPQDPNTPKYIVPVKITGPIEFTLLAVWTTNSKPSQYIRGLAKAIDIYEHLLRGQPSVVMGDFNSNAIWDERHPKDLNHSSVVNRLQRCGLISAYHFKRNEEHGLERESTFYHHWKPEKPFHIDYCFISRSWQHSILEVHVGSYEDWKTHSDHRPLAVEISENGV